MNFKLFSSSGGPSTTMWGKYYNMMLTSHVEDLPFCGWSHPTLNTGSQINFGVPDLESVLNSKWCKNLSLVPTEGTQVPVSQGQPPPQADCFTHLFTIWVSYHSWTTELLSSSVCNCWGPQQWRHWRVISHIPGFGLIIPVSLQFFPYYFIDRDEKKASDMNLRDLSNQDPRICDNADNSMHSLTW